MSAEESGGASQSTPDGVGPRIALCLSGGGFRAAIFHLGALRRLHELGILEQVDMITAVSGGSILSGFLADRMKHLTPGATSMKFDRWEEDIAIPFRDVVSHDLRTLPVLLTLGLNMVYAAPRVKLLEWRYRRRLTRLRLCDLPEHPTFVFCATSMTFGTNWEFRKDELGEYMGGYAKTPKHFPLARAITASSSFPPIFGPVRINIPPEAFRNGHYKTKKIRLKMLRGLSLTDGGVYDNTGMEPAIPKRDTAPEAVYDIVLVSDCGAPMPFKATRFYFSRLFRYSSLVMEQVGRLRRRLFVNSIREDRCVCRRSTDGTLTPFPRQRGALWRLTGDPSKRLDQKNLYAQNTLVEPFIAEIRTDLDRFTAAEIAILENHGYALADATLKAYLPDLAEKTPAPFCIPHPAWWGPGNFIIEAKIRRALRFSSSVTWCFLRWFEPFLPSYFAS